MSTHCLSQRPTSDEYFEFYHTYIRLVPDGHIIETASAQLERVSGILADVSEDDSKVIHAPYTWTIRQVLGHIIDAERIFADRLHRISSGDPQPQLGMDQDLYVNGQDFATPLLSSLAEEWQSLRRANILLMSRIRIDAWSFIGSASGYPVTVRALAWMIVGHVTHHMNIVCKRLDVAAP
jgi:uncharacterized damage-inducible protein DinB